MNAFAYFPSVIYRDEKPEFIEKILPLCNRSLNLIRKPEEFFCQTENLIFEKEIQEFKTYILNSSIKILQEQGYDVEKYDFYVSNMWAQETSRGNGTNAHVHKNSQISGWFFLEVPENNSFPSFYDPRNNKSMIELDFVQENNITFATNRIFFTNVVPGTVLYNNSWLQHELIGGKTDLPTKTVHFIISHKDRLCNI